MVNDKEKRSPARPRSEMYLELLYHENGGKKMQLKTEKERELDKLILERAHILLDLQDLQQKKRDCDYKISKLRFEMNEREDDK
ncbi:MAG TPA: hypothetical protein DHM90_09100 [Clostridiaceae bacterium]|nr:hypothetical protein [Clostridiaceae bacterium]